MPFQQLYYTSCERGLSGFPGYQFNAATPGVTPEVMRQVEVLTAYEPPRSVGYQPTEAEIAASPVNLCFVPAPTTILAQVVFVGDDFSKRPGNYFAHALVATVPDGDLTELLPIELWRAPVWQRQPSDTLELQEHPGPLPRGGIDRGGVQRFLDARADAGTSGPLPALLSAAAGAVTGDARYVILVEETSDDAAHWIAAISYLLPPRLASRMSFATYHHQPSYAQLNVVATVPDADVDRSDAALEHSCVFDLPGRRTSRVPVHPLAELLVDQVGVALAGDFWAQATELARGGETSLDDWLPIAAATAAERRLPLARAHLDAALGWLAEEGERLGPERTTGLAAVLLDHPEATDGDAQRLLAGVTGIGPGLREAAERRLVDAWFDRLQGGGAAATDEPPVPTSAAGHEHLDRRLRQALDTAPPEVVATLLAWAVRNGLPVGPETMRRTGQLVLAPWLMEAEPSEVTRWLLPFSQEVRTGVVEHLAAAAETAPEDVLAALRRGLGLLLGRYDAAHSAPLRQLLLVAAADLRKEGRMESLCEILQDSDPPTADRLPQLLGWLWPNGRWSVQEARQLLGRVPPESLPSDAVADWLAVTLNQPVETRAELQRYADLCRTLRKHPITDTLPEHAEGPLHDAARVQELLRSADKDPTGRVDARILEELTDLLDTAAPPVGQLVTDAVPGLLLRADADVVVELLPRCDTWITEGYAELARGELRRHGPQSSRRAAFAAKVFQVAIMLQQRRHPLGDHLDQAVLAEVARTWDRREVQLLAGTLAEAGDGWDDAFRRWYAERRRGDRAGVLGRLPDRLGRIRPRRPPPG